MRWDTRRLHHVRRHFYAPRRYDLSFASEMRRIDLKKKTTISLTWVHAVHGRSLCVCIYQRIRALSGHLALTISKRNVRPFYWSVICPITSGPSSLFNETNGCVRRFLVTAFTTNDTNKYFALTKEPMHRSCAEHDKMKRNRKLLSFFCIALARGSNFFSLLMLIAQFMDRETRGNTACVRIIYWERAKYWISEWTTQCEWRRQSEEFARFALFFIDLAVRIHSQTLFCWDAKFISRTRMWLPRWALWIW